MIELVLAYLLINLKGFSPVNCNEHMTRNFLINIIYPINVGRVMTY